MQQNNQQQPQNPTTNNSTPNNTNQFQVPKPQVPPQPPVQSNQPKPQNIPPKPPATPMAPSGQSKKNLVISGIVILVVLALLLVIPRLNGGDSTPETENELTTEQTENGTEQTGSTNEDEPLSRTAALVAYEGKMLTITGDCEVAPEDQTQAAGTTILINNDTAEAHTITVGPKSYRVSGLHYTLSWLNMVPGTLAITCDGEESDATIVVK
jgi:hypothetical protein